MSTIRFPTVACQTLLVLFAGLAFVVLASGSSYAADYKSIAVVPSPKPMGDTPSGAELVGKLLDERSTASDPNIPLPQRNLSPSEPVSEPLTGPQIYGRRDEGSVVVGLKIPIPADRGASQ